MTLPGTAPIDLRAFAGAELQPQVGGLAHRPHLVDELLEDRAASRVARGFELLEDLLGRLGIRAFCNVGRPAHFCTVR
jgi:hypothetical protein